MSMHSKFKTPEPVRVRARNAYRRKKGIPPDAPLHSRADPFNRRRRGTGNRKRQVSMPPAAWALVRKLKGRRTAGECIHTALELLEMTE